MLMMIMMMMTMSEGKHAGWESSAASWTWQVSPVRPWHWQSDDSVAETVRNVGACWQCCDVVADIRHRYWKGQKL